MALRGWIRLTRTASAVGLAAFALVTVAAQPGSGFESFFNVWVYNALMVLACVVVASRALLVADERPAWVAFTAATVSWTFGEIWAAAAVPESYPSLADLGFIGFYPLCYLGMVALIRSRAGRIRGTLWLDGVTASLAAAAVGAAVLFELVLVTTEGSPATVATNLAYPLGDVLLLSAVVGVFSLSAWKPGLRWTILGVGILFTLVADAIYLFQSAAGTYVEGTWIDILWPASLLLIASAAWVGDRRGAGIETTGKPLLAVPAVCAIVSIAILVYDHFTRLSVIAVALAAATLLAVLVRLATTFRDNRRLYELTRHEATTDALTELGNRRKLLADLDRLLDHPRAEPTLLMIFDLDGFKGYNDTFGHPAGDALLARLGAKLAAVPGPTGAAYRLGGDEFCLVVPIADGGAELVIDRACEALRERGEGFDVGSSFGAVILPEEAADASSALHVADERLYAQKHSRRSSSTATMEALLDALSVREPDLLPHLVTVGSLAHDTGRRLGLGAAALDELARAAQLHDLGKLAVPDEILHKAGPLDEREWAFVRQHTLVGERILRASPDLRRVATIVRSTHERWDGTGYPDGLTGEEIPLASRIIAACDAFTATTSPRPYRAQLTEQEALAELERNAGTQFDPAVVVALTETVRARVGAERSG
jgi:two-component system, cell cycle response regulator